MQAAADKGSPCIAYKKQMTPNNYNEKPDSQPELFCGGWISAQKNKIMDIKVEFKVEVKVEIKIKVEIEVEIEMVSNKVPSQPQP